MRIGMMADMYKPYVSGVTNYISLNKTFLEQLGHQVFVFTFGDEDYPEAEERVIRSPGLPFREAGVYISLRYSKQARKLLNTMNVVHVHHPFLSGSLALRYCRPRGIPIIFTNHTRYDLYVQAYIPGLPEIVGTTAIQAYMPSFCKACDLVIAPSKGMRNVLESFGVDTPIDVVPNGVDIQPFLHPARIQDRREFGIDPQDVLLIYSGRLGPEKNLPFLLRSFLGVASAFENVHLMFLGDGSEKAELEKSVQEKHISRRVHFTGMIPYAELPTYLKMGDAFVTASVTEVHPLSMIEAMAAGLPVLGINSPGIGDTIQDGFTGFLVQEEEIASFTAMLARLVVEKDARRRMSDNARKAAEMFAIERTAKLMEERYHQVIQIAAGRRLGLRTRLYRWFDRLRGSP